MAAFRIDSIEELARQMTFTPVERAAQLASAESLLHEIDAAKAYPLDFVIFRITGYHPKHVAEGLLTGLAHQHDLGLLIERLSETLEVTRPTRMSRCCPSKMSPRGSTSRAKRFSAGGAGLAGAAICVSGWQTARRFPLAASSGFSRRIGSRLPRRRIFRRLEDEEREQILRRPGGWRAMSIAAMAKSPGESRKMNRSPRRFFIRSASMMRNIRQRRSSARAAANRSR